VSGGRSKEHIVLGLFCSKGKARAKKGARQALANGRAGGDESGRGRMKRGGEVGSGFCKRKEFERQMAARVQKRPMCTGGQNNQDRGRLAGKGFRMEYP